MDWSLPGPSVRGILQFNLIGLKYYQLQHVINTKIFVWCFPFFSWYCLKFGVCVTPAAHLTWGWSHLQCSGWLVATVLVRLVWDPSVRRALEPLPSWSLHSSLEKESVSKKTRWTLILGGHAFCVTRPSLTKLEAPWVLPVFKVVVKTMG